MPAKKKVLKVAKQSIEQYIETTTNNLCDMDLNALFTALDKIKNAHSSDGNEDGFNNIKSAFLAKWSDKVIDLLVSSTLPAGVAKIIQECGALSFAYPPLLDKCISLTSEAIESYDVHQLSVILKGLAQLDYYDENFIPLCLYELNRDGKINDANSHDLSTILWSCAKLRYQDSEFASRWFDVAAAKIESFSQEDLCQSIQGVAKLGQYNKHFIIKWIDRVNDLGVMSFSPMPKLNNAYYLSMIKLNSAGEDFKSSLDGIIVDLIATVRKKDLKTVEDKRQFLISRNLLPEEKQQELGIREEGYLYTLRADVEVESIPYVSNLQKKIFERAKDIRFVGEKVTSEHWVEEILNHVDLYVGEVRVVMQVDGHQNHCYRNGEVNATTDFNTNMLLFFDYKIYRGNDDDFTNGKIRKFLLPLFNAKAVETAEGKLESTPKDDVGSNMFNHLSSSDDSDNETVLEEKSDIDSSASAKVAEGEKVSKSPKKTKQIKEAEDNAVIETAIIQVAEQDAIYKQLYLAVMRQEIDVVKSYKQYISTSPYPLVDTAAMKNNLEMMRYLLRRSANPNKVGVTGDYAVHIAVKIHNVEMLELLADYGARLNVSNKKGNTPLIEFSKFLASSELSIDDKNIFDVEMFFVLNKMVLLKDIIHTNSLGNSLLHLAAIHGHIGLVKYMLQKEKLVDIANHEGNTPLHHAASHGHDGIVEFLLQKQASVNAIDESGKTALYRAACSRYDAIVKLLLKAGALVDSKEQSGLTPLHAAVYHSHDSTVKLLLDNGGLVDAADNKGITPLHIAATNGHDGIVQILLEHGASTEAKNNQDFTPLYLAIYGGRDTTAEILLEKGASINGKYNEGDTLLDIAVILGRSVSVVGALIQRGALVDYNQDRFTSLCFFARKRKDDKILKLLIEERAQDLLDSKAHAEDTNSDIIDTGMPHHNDDITLSGEIVSDEG